MNKSKYIETLFNPSLTIASIRGREVSEKHADPEGATVDQFNKNQGEVSEKYLGLKTVLTVINGLTLQPTMIDSLSIDLTGFYPTITMRIFPSKGEFINFALPKDGDIISVYYRSTLDEYKPIRMDFVVVNCYEEQLRSWVLHGVINIPNLFKDTSYSKEANSLETMIDVSKKLKLGFATNTQEMDDKQRWVSANQPLETFIEDLTLHSWKDERSFFKSYIDNNYILNFIDVRAQLDTEKDKPVYPGRFKIRDFIQTNQYTVFDYDDTIFEYDYPVILTNWIRNVFEENTIENIRVLNQSSRISLEEGYRKYLHMYDDSLDGKIELPNQLVISDGGTEDNIVLLGGVTDKDWKSNSRHLWKGINYSLPDHNTHPFYYVAEYHNEQNLKETEKLTIEITLNQVNFNLHRDMIIPVIYYEYGDIARKLREAGEKYNSITIEEKHETVTEQYIVNNFISGFYIVQGMYIEHMGPREGNPSYVRQRVILTRTEWPKSVIVTDRDNLIVSNINK